MERSRLVEKPVDRQAFFLAGRGNRPALAIKFDRALRCIEHARRRIGRSAPPAGRQRQAEREQTGAENGNTNHWAVEAAHEALPRNAPPYSRWTAAGEWHAVGAGTQRKRGNRARARL